MREPPRVCVVCCGTEDVRWVEPMIGWGNSFTGYERRRAYCWKCRHRHNGHWRWHDKRDAKLAAKWRQREVQDGKAKATQAAKVG